MKPIIFTLATLALFVFSSCTNPLNCEKGEGEVVSQALDLPAISGMELHNSASVRLTHSANEQSVSVSGQKNVIDNLDLEVKDGIWRIDYDTCVRSSEEVVISISLPKLEHIGISGSGDIQTTNHFPNQGNLNIDINGSGDLDLSIDVSDLEVEIQGSGNVKLSGNAGSAEYDIDGSGDVTAYDFTTADVEVDINGSGNVEVQAGNSLEVEINGSGDVYYKGSPQIAVDMAGSGEIHNSN